MRRVIACLLVACNSSSSSSSSSSPPPPEAKKPELTVTIDGKPVSMAKALIKDLPAGRAQLHVTSGDATCQELLANVFNQRKDAQTLLLNIGPRLAPDGTLATVVTDVFIRGSGEVAPGSSASITGNKVTLDYTATGDGHTHVVKGTVTAERCGDPAKPPATSTATVTVAGKSLPLVGAITKGDTLVLSTQTLDCSPSRPWAEIILERHGLAWSLAGEWIGKTVSNSSMIDRKTGQEETKDLTVTGAPELAFAGSGTIGGYPVALAGKIKATPCAP
jgi:hypothetical protein